MLFCGDGVLDAECRATDLPSCCTEEWSRERSRELRSSSSLKEESSSSVFWPSRPTSFSLARRSCTSSRVVAPPDTPPVGCVAIISFQIYILHV